MNLSPDICPKCGHKFSPAAPEPSWCPGCGKLCSAYEQSDDPEPLGPDELPETPKERARWRVWFWVLFLLGPALAILSVSMSRMLLNQWLGWLGPFARPALAPLFVLFASAGGAGFCLAKLWRPRRPIGGQLAFAFAMGIVLMMVYAGIAFAGCVIASSTAR